MTPARRGAWGAVVVSLTAALAIQGCQDGYPIAATACDRYCDLGMAPGCGDYRPTECVVSCEAHWASMVCSSEFDDWVSCLKERKHTLVCDYSLPVSNDGCEAVLNARLECWLDYAARVRNGKQ